MRKEGALFILRGGERKRRREVLEKRRRVHTLRRRAHKRRRVHFGRGCT
jgi:hypothetical protein